MVSQPKIDYTNRLIDESLLEGDDTIELKGKFIGDEGVEALLLSNKLEYIEDLDLSNNSITWRGAVKLFKSDKFKNLKRLFLNYIIMEIIGKCIQIFGFTNYFW